MRVATIGNVYVPKLNKINNTSKSMNFGAISEKTAKRILKELDEDYTKRLPNDVAGHSLYYEKYLNKYINAEDTRVSLMLEFKNGRNKVYVEEPVHIREHSERSFKELIGKFLDLTLLGSNMKRYREDSIRVYEEDELDRMYDYEPPVWYF